MSASAQRGSSKQLNRCLHSGSTRLLRHRPMASSVPSAQDFADRRAHPRVSIALPAFLEADGERHHVQILDLSAGGAKANCAAGLSAGMAVNLDCGTFVREAVVRWQN